jgi:hypothetical protein
MGKTGQDKKTRLPVVKHSDKGIDKLKLNFEAEAR